MSETRVLIHISDRDKWSSALGEVKAFMTADSASRREVIVLADIFAGAVCIACDRRLRELMKELVEGGLAIWACEQSLRNLNLRPEALPAFIRTVPNALSAIVQKQLEGFHYIKV
jgi:intracellular sulfur oxidation DsrE/DsrF family protein